MKESIKFLLEDAGAMPWQVKELVNALIEGRVKQMIFVAEMSDGNIADMFHIAENNANRYAMLGAIESIKRDYMRSQIRSRIDYVERGDVDDWD